MDFGCQKIQCISLTNRTDKREYFSNMMKNRNVNFEFFDAIRDTDIPSRGCFRSHFKIISNSLTLRILLCEPYNPFTLNPVKQAIKVTPREK